MHKNVNTLSPEIYLELDSVLQSKPRLQNPPKNYSSISYLKSIIGAVVFLILTIYLGINIPKDYTIRQDMVAVDTDYIHGHCSQYLRVFLNCDVDFKIENKTYNQHLTFLDFSKKIYEVNVYASRSNPDLMALDLAIDKLYNRIFTTLLFFFLSMFLFLRCFQYYKDTTVNDKRISQIMSELNMAPKGTPILLQAIPASQISDKKGLSYTANIKGAKKFVHFNHIHPLTVEIQNEIAILVLVNSASKNFIVLDQDLMFFDLNEHEKNAFCDRLKDIQ
ncbi:hypothetical protein [Ignatzschineria sp. LJL83]